MFNMSDAVLLTKRKRSVNAASACQPVQREMVMERTSLPSRARFACWLRVTVLVVTLNHNSIQHNDGFSVYIAVISAHSGGTCSIEIPFHCQGYR